MYHVELRQFPHAARAFNLTREELDQRFIRPWVAGVPLELDDRRWPQDKTRLTIYEAPELPTEDMGMGRGWGNVRRTGEDVTSRLLSQAEGTATALAAELERFKDDVVERCAAEPQSLHSLLLAVNQGHPGWRVSDRVALVERAAWELLHQQRIELIDAGTGDPVPSAQWQDKLLAWESWTEERVAVSSLREQPRG